jgi:uncharacterized protein (DUF1697 family)
MTSTLTKYVCLLRAINVGGNATISMKKLKESFEAMGFKNVVTHINSGNVVFEASLRDEVKLTSLIEKEIKKDFGIDVKVLLRDDASIAKLIKKIPKTWVNDKDMKCDVMFLWKEVDTSAVLKEFLFNKEIEDLKYFPGAVVWRIDRVNATRSKIVKVVGTKLHKLMTVRNVNTVRKLHTLLTS